ncbi:MAG: RNA polymerase sigma factor [Eubacterium sp.]|nr:RNA polymerase sigma factor [Eubacterium sp.]
MEMEEQYDRIYRYCYYKIQHVALAEDITQETFLHYLEKEKTDVERPLAYLYTIARNLCVDELRKRKIQEALESKIDHFSDTGRDMQSVVTDHIVLQQALQLLTEEERELVILRFVNDVSAADLAVIYGISRFAVYRRVSRTLGKLKRSMEGQQKKRKRG